MRAQGSGMFLGTMIRWETRENSDERRGWLRRVAYLRVDEDFDGFEKGAEVAVFTGSGGGDCGYRFELGEQYLVDTGRLPNGEFTTSICSDTAPRRYAQSLINQLRALRIGRSPASLYGTLLQRFPKPDDEYGASPPVPVEGVMLRLRTKHQVLDTKTGKDGVFEFWNLSEGEYVLTADTPDGVELMPQEPFSLQQGACHEIRPILLPSAKLTGRLISRDGEALSGQRLTLLADGQIPKAEFWRFRIAYTDADGRFSFENLPAGGYKLGAFIGASEGSPYRTTFFPSASAVDSATVINVADGQKITVEVRANQAEQLIPLVVQVNWPDGRRAPSARVYIATKDEKFREGLWVDANGEAHFKRVQGIDYMLNADIACPANNPTAPKVQVVGKSSLDRIVLTLDKNSCPAPKQGEEN